jgi:CIC family chloride channel protein
MRRIQVYISKYAQDKFFLYLLSILIGLVTGVAVILLKSSTAYIENLLEYFNEFAKIDYLYFIFPLIGIALTVLIIRYIIRRHVGHDGIPRILYAISRREGFVEAHNMFSSAITSAFTVGFGGSAGLEGPVVTTGGAIGSQIARVFKISYRKRIILIGSATAAAISAIFEAPIAGIVFALEVMMIDLTTSSLIPLALASITGSIVSMYFSGQNVLFRYPLVGENSFNLANIPYYILLGILMGLVALYFTRSYSLVVKLFDGIKHKWQKILFGGLILGLLVFLFPALYGEGYQSINSAINGNYEFLFGNTIFNQLSQNSLSIILLLIILTFIKPIATTVTFEAGGIGGIFAPTMFMGAMLGLAFALIVNQTGIFDINPANSILVGMASLLASIIQAPLTGIFLISEITHGYNLMMPLMLSSIISFGIVRIFHSGSVYTKQLAQRGDLLTHHADKNALTLMNVRDLIETNFRTVHPDATLRKIVQLFSESERNVFPVIDENQNLLGIITLNRIRKIMFQNDLYDTVTAKELMFVPEVIVNTGDSMETVANKIQKSGKFNVAVLDNEGKYLGFISRANVFSTYRNLLKEFSSD